MLRSDFFSDAPAREPSALTGFSGGRLDRRSEARDEATVAVALAHPERRTYAFSGARLVLRRGEPLLTDDDLAALDPIEADPDALPPGCEAVPLRPLYVANALAPDRFGAIALGHSLLHWIALTRHCGRCGTRTELRAGGMRRECPSCGLKQFPRTDPVAIMLPVSADGAACVLGRSPHFPSGMVSCLAGFIEPGETIEAAVRRETREEAGVQCGRVRYHASQPWPMPHSLMIGCYVEASGDVAFDATELEACRWYDRDEVRAILRGAHGNSAPPPGAIAHLLMRHYADD